VTLSAGSKLGPYEIAAPIGAGGMGEVYRATDPRLGRDVAIKVLPASFSQDADRLRRFEQEARAAGVLNHPNITAVHDIGSHEGAPYVVQELLEGDTLRSVLSGGRLPQRKTIDYGLQIVHGLAAAHEKGIVHRDLKPENVFVTNDGRVKILDFGLAKLTHIEERGQATNLPTATAGTEPGVVMGTLGYMSPEQVRGKPADARSDIFSFGAILYEMLCGKRAFHGDSAADTMSAILKEDPPDLSITNQNIPAGLERIVRHCLEKSPEQRFHSAHDVAFDLEALSGLSTPRLEPSKSRAPVRLPPLGQHLAGAPRGRRQRRLGQRRNESGRRAGATVALQAGVSFRKSPLRDDGLDQRPAHFSEGRRHRISRPPGLRRRPRLGRDRGSRRKEKDAVRGVGKHAGPRLVTLRQGNLVHGDPRRQRPFCLRRDARGPRARRARDACRTVASGHLPRRARPPGPEQRARRVLRRAVR
jgi:serine/threonine protein kinase